MHAVYQKTSRTFVGLRKADESSAEAIETIALIHKQMCAETENATWLREVLPVRQGKHLPVLVFQIAATSQL